MTEAASSLAVFRWR